VLLSYELASPERVRLAVYDLGGREVAVVDEGARGAGIHEIAWDGRDRSGRRAGAGIYFFRLEAGRREESRKLVLLD
jgi:flagellar hook assembly protein FlgD